MAKCKITVLRRMFNEDYTKEYCANPETGPCTVFQEGQVFLLENLGKPAGFCEEAWSAITRSVFAFMADGGDFDFWGGRWMKQRNMMIACCNDGVRPVVFKIERED